MPEVGSHTDEQREGGRSSLVAQALTSTVRSVVAEEWSWEGGGGNAVDVDDDKPGFAELGRDDVRAEARSRLGAGQDTEGLTQGHDDGNEEGPDGLEGRDVMVPLMDVTRQEDSHARVAAVSCHSTETRCCVVHRCSCA